MDDCDTSEAIIFIGQALVDFIPSETYHTFLSSPTLSYDCNTVRPHSTLSLCPRKT